MVILPSPPESSSGAELDLAILMSSIIVGCPQIGPGLKPCTRIVAIIDGQVLPSQEGSPFFDTLRALTDGSPPGVVTVTSFNPPINHSQETRISAQLKMVTSEMVRHLAKKPDLLYKIDPRRFEELVADLLRDMGFDVQLTPQTRDGGRDILAIYRSPIAKLLTVVDCKRYAPNRPIGPEIVQRLLWIADNHDRASHAMIATTSFFTKGAVEIKNEYQWRLTLADLGEITKWLGQYGNWRANDHTGLWVPRQS
jgi:restriction endonuclease Mrr